jgi:hypothetical protein
MQSHIVRAGCYGLAVIALVVSVAGLSYAGTVSRTPEIDGSTVSAGIGLLAAGALILRARMRSK